MKRVVLFALGLMLSLSSFAQQSYSHFTARKSPAWFQEGLSYQLQPRSFSEEGTLKGAEKHLKRIADLGVTVVYLTPVCVADTDMDQTKWSPRQHKSGFNDPRNPYRAGDYFHVDPEYGTDQDLRDFVKKAHSLGMKVFLDLVFAHCGPSAKVAKEHPEYFKYDAQGNMMVTRWKFPMFDPEYSGTRAFFRSVMRHYLTDYDVDGFRCDVAEYVPISFWEEARAEFEKIKPDLVMVAESNTNCNTRYAFDASYGWEINKDVLRALMIGKAVGIQKNMKPSHKVGMAAVREAHEKMNALRPKGSLTWNMYENHDFSTDSFHNRIEKICGHKCCEVMIAFTFALDGVPFIFNGQEIAYDKRLSLFGHKDCWIDWKKDGATAIAKERTEKIKAFTKMRREQKALSYGDIVWIDNDRPVDVCSFKRTLEGADDVLFVGNFTDVETKVTLADGTKYTLAPWAYIFEPQKKR